MTSETNSASNKGTIHYHSSAYKHVDGCDGFCFTSVIDPGPGCTTDADQKAGVKAHEKVKSTVWDNASTAGKSIVWGRPDAFGLDGPDGPAQSDMPAGWSVERKSHSLDIKNIEKEVKSRKY